MNKLTEQQKLVIADVTKKYNQASQQISNLSEEKKNLNKKVTLAAQLDATNIRIEPRNKRGKVAKKVKDVVKLAISFTVVRILQPKMANVLFIYVSQSRIMMY